jgi:sigma-E factor negative regulatory protein RseC
MVATMAEQTTVRAVVRALDSGSALVEVEQGGCGRCHEKGGCGGRSLTQMFCSEPKRYRVANDVDASVGDHVTVAIAAGSVRRSANLAYILPLTATIAGALLGMELGDDQGAMLGAVAGLLLSFIYIARRPATGFSESRPHIISRSS